jgi:hypothetical protein
MANEPIRAVLEFRQQNNTFLIVGIGAGNDSHTAFRITQIVRQMRHERVLFRCWRDHVLQSRSRSSNRRRQAPASSASAEAVEGFALVTGASSGIRVIYVVSE